MRLRSIAVATAVPLAVAAQLTIATSSADASLTTSCRGTAGAVTVPGDLVVPAGASCDLTGTTVEGNTTVRRGATLLLDGVELNGNLVVQADGYAEATGSTVAGTTRLASSFGLMAEDSELMGAVTSATGGFLYASNSMVSGNVRSGAAETVLETVVVEGSVVTNGDTLSDLYDSTVYGDVTVSQSLAGSAVCASEVDGNLTVRGSAGLVAVGDPAVGECGTAYVGGNLVLRDNTGGVNLVGTIVRGSADCTANDPAPTGTGNRFRGGATGQCATLAPAAGAKARGMRSSSLSVADRSSSIEQRAAERSAAGEAAAAAAGPARIGG